MEFQETFEKYLEDWDYIAASKSLEDPALKDWLKKNAAFELIPLCINYISDEQEAKGPHMVNGCAQLLLQLARVAPPKEALIALIEHCEAFQSSLKFRHVLPSLAVVLQRMHDDPQSRKKLALTFDWSLETVVNHIETLIIPDIPETLSTSEERLVLDSDPEMADHLNTLQAFTDFIDALWSHLSHQPEFDDKVKCKNCLVRTAMSALGQPLVYLNLEVHQSKCGAIKSSALRIGEILVKIVVSVAPNVFTLREADYLKQDSEKSRNQLDFALGCLYFVIFNDFAITDESQRQNFIFSLPSIYHPVHIFNLALPSVNSMMTDQGYLSLFKALNLAEHLMSRIPATTLDGTILEMEAHTEFLQKILKIVVFNPMENFRQMAFQLFRKYFDRFSIECGMYRMCQVLLDIANHSGLIGYVVGQIKDVVLKQLNGKIDAPQFRGHSLKVLVRKFIKLTNGPETDLLEVSDELMAGINFLILVFLRDSSNETGLLDMKSELRKEFLEPLEVGINMSKAHYQAKLDSDPSVTDDVMSLQVGGQLLPQMSREEQKNVINAALNTFSMLECVLIQLKDVLDKK